MTKFNSPLLSSPTCSLSNAHQIRLAQQKLLLELTSNQLDEEFQSIKQDNKLEEMTLVELKHQCKFYQISSSHGNKNQLIDRIRKAKNQKLLQSKSSGSIFIDFKLFFFGFK